MRISCLTTQGARWEDGLRAERENTARSANAPLKEGAAVCGSRLEDPRLVGLQPSTPATSRSPGPGHSQVARGGRRLTS